MQWVDAIVFQMSFDHWVVYNLECFFLKIHLFNYYVILTYLTAKHHLTTRADPDPEGRVVPSFPQDYTHVRERIRAHWYPYYKATSSAKPYLLRCKAASKEGGLW